MYLLYVSEKGYKKHRIIQIFLVLEILKIKKKKKERNDSDLRIILQAKHDKYSYRIFHMGYTFINAETSRGEIRSGRKSEVRR